ncbi:MAG: hypothetical protein JO306_13350 [Gemmatimonadetes bacterium]|nr:hypothetical protein [Gemmatimonadota bacterium]
MRDARWSRIAAIVGAVARQALADRGADRIALLDDGGPEAELAARFLAAELGDAAVLRITLSEREMEPVLHLAPEVSGERLAEETRRMKARLSPRALPANAANKTALLLGGELPPEPFLPLGDLWASEVAALCGDWSASAEARAIAEAAGGIEALDAALRNHVDSRDPAALGVLPCDAADAVRRAIAAGRASRLNARVVPKIGARTLGVDLFD